MNVNTWDVHDAIRDLIRSRELVDVDQLRNSEIAIADVARAVEVR
jgi:hypothetical protein